jgi:hypothetical protein
MGSSHCVITRIVVPVAKSDIGKYKLFNIVSRLDLHTKNNNTVTVSRLIFAKQKRLHWNWLHRHSVAFDFCATKAVTTTPFAQQKTVTRTHLQNHDKLNWMAHKLQCFYTALHVYNMLIVLQYPESTVEFEFLILPSMFMHICLSGNNVQHPLRAQAMLLAKNSVMESSQNLTEALGTNGKSFHASTFRHCGQIKTTSTSNTTFC